MKHMNAAKWFSLFALLIGVVNCALLTPKNVRTVLNAIEIACVLGTEATDDSTVAKLCGIEDNMAPAVKELLAGKKASKKAGACK